MQKTRQEIDLIQFPREESVAFDQFAFDENIVAHGPTFIHWQALPDPIGLQSKFDSRRPDGVNNTNAFNGFYYIKRGRVAAILTNNSKEAKASSGGIVDAGVAQLTPCTTYFDTQEKVYLSPYDRLYLEEESILVPRGELVETTLQGTDTLAFPAVKVIAIVDADGIEYAPQSYSVINGTIVWNPEFPRPTFNPEVNKGKVYSIKYLHRPFYYVFRLLHELRLMQTIDQIGERRLLQVNQSAIVHREYLFQNKYKDSSDPDQTGAVEKPVGN